VRCLTPRGGSVDLQDELVLEVWATSRTVAIPDAWEGGSWAGHGSFASRHRGEKPNKFAAHNYFLIFRRSVNRIALRSA
jgi:hypothetical protein